LSVCPIDGEFNAIDMRHQMREKSLKAGECGRGLPTSGCRLPAAGFRRRDAGFRLRAADFRPPAAGRGLPAPGCGLSVVAGWGLRSADGMGGRADGR